MNFKEVFNRAIGEQLEADPLVINTATDITIKAFREAVATVGFGVSNGVMTIEKNGEAEFTSEFLAMINGEMMDLEADKELVNTFEEKLIAGKLETIPGLPGALIGAIGKALADIALEHRNEDGKSLRVEFIEMGDIEFKYPSPEEVTVEFFIDPKFAKKLS